MTMFEQFVDSVSRMLVDHAGSQGYLGDAMVPREAPNGLFAFMSQYFPDHAMGEVVYKAVRYINSEAPNPDDLVKIAAWAYLEWLGNEVKAKDEGEEESGGCPTCGRGEEGDV